MEGPELKGYSTLVSYKLSYTCDRLKLRLEITWQLYILVTQDIYMYVLPNITNTRVRVMFVGNDNIIY